MRPPPQESRLPTSESTAPRPRGAALALGLVFLVAGFLDALACRSARPVPGPPVAPEAARAFAEARAHQRAEDEPAALAAARRAAELAPDWAAPRRLLDDRARSRLATAAALDARLAAAETGDDPTALYLAGRLEGRSGLGRFREACRRNPSDPWPRHGLAWMHFLDGDVDAAWEAGVDAVRLARERWEEAHFLMALGRYAIARGAPEEGLAQFDAAARGDRLSDVPALPRPEQLQLSAWRALLELAQAEGEDAAPAGRAERGIARALGLLADPTLPADALDYLTSALVATAARSERTSLLDELHALLTRRADPAALRALVRLEEREHGARAASALADALAGRLAEGASAADVWGATGSLRTATLLEEGAFARALDTWLAGQPRFLLDDEGLPVREALRVVVATGRALQEAGGEPSAAQAFGSALVAAGWFEEALGLARWLRERDVDRALALEARARRGLALLAVMREVFDDVDQERGRGGIHYTDPEAAGTLWAPDPGEGKAEGRPLRSLDDVLDALAPAVARAFGEEAAESLRASPRLSFGPFASLVHPGPRFSGADAAAGLGNRGEEVPGLARLFAQLGRFAIVGRVRGGGGPDGSVLRLLALEPVDGVHLGVPFSGTVAWCDGQDVLSRPARRGARVTGAALHEGFWIDVAEVRTDARRWRALQDRWLGPAPPADPAAVVADPGVRLALGEGSRRAPYAVGDVGDRIRLAVLLERAEAAEQGWSNASIGPDLVTFEELLDVVARHEEGHLCDRTRFLPLGAHLWEVLGFVVRAGFSPTTIARRIEYRAQLTALCVAADPRLALADVVDAIEGGTAVTAHTAAYAELLEDLLAALDEAGVEAFPALDPAHYLVHQLPRLSSEEVRRLALAVAERQGMVEAPPAAGSPRPPSAR